MHLLCCPTYKDYEKDISEALGGFFLILPLRLMHTGGGLILKITELNLHKLLFCHLGQPFMIISCCNSLYYGFQVFPSIRFCCFESLTSFICAALRPIKNPFKAVSLWSKHRATVLYKSNHFPSAHLSCFLAESDEI